MAPAGQGRPALGVGCVVVGQDVVGAARAEVFKGCGVKGDCLEQWGQTEGEGRVEREKKVCALKGWEGGRENGEENCVCMGSHGAAWQTRGRCSWRGASAKVSFCDTSGDQKAKWPPCTVLASLGMSCGCAGPVLWGRRVTEASAWTHHTPPCLLHLRGGLSSFYLNALLSKNHNKHSTFAKSYAL